jgi:hypothetical protein
MPVTPEKVFIYGRFVRAEYLFSPLGMIAVPPDIAVEILREFSATELVGKVYVKGRGGTWAPASQPGIREYSWYKELPEHGLLFETEGSTPWKVLYFRQESDDSGPYVAVGLKLEP